MDFAFKTLYSLVATRPLCHSIAAIRAGDPSSRIVGP
ncbi:hypothetical protein [Sporisorium scitamineum]|uniref:Uncharacterized protein n=1 Tax=Sporisorium scitamineum TaxID=49012 RepID=A0A0F7RYY4_9BASI|nr:hypothetical protein [Sporisorium scitamineum]